MTLEEYEEAGRKHTKKDKEVGLDDMMDNQRKLNGHVSMLLKTFLVGARWGHAARHRATKLTYCVSGTTLSFIQRS